MLRFCCIQGWIPHSVVDQAMVGVLMNYIVYLRNRLADVIAENPQTEEKPLANVANGHVPSDAAVTS